MAARFPLDVHVQIILEDEEPIMGFDSESDISDEEDPIEDPDYCPPGVVRPPRNAASHRNQPLPDEQYQSDPEESSDERKKKWIGLSYPTE